MRRAIVLVLVLAGCPKMEPGPGEPTPATSDAAAPATASSPDAAPATAPDTAPEPRLETKPDAAPAPDTAPACGQAGDPCGAGCCSGTTCVNVSGLVNVCAANCTKASDCQSGYCAPLKSGGSVCGPASNPSGGGGAGGGIQPGTFKVTVSRDSQDLYKTTLPPRVVITTQNCDQYVYLDKATLIWTGSPSPSSQIVFSNGHSCKVTDVVAGL